MKFSAHKFLILATLFLSACASAAQELNQNATPSSEVGKESSPAASPSASVDTASPPDPSPTFLPLDDTPPRSAEREFSTDFSKHSVPFDEILSGGPGKNGIPAIDNPQFIGVSEAVEWLQPQEPVILVQVSDDVRAYPIQILIWHEIVNDTIGGTPLVVTFCPLCNTGIAFERTVNGRVLDFGTTGRLRFSNLIMYDRQTETWWQQASGNAIAGELTGTRLNFYPAAMISWRQFKSEHPGGKVLSRDTGFNRSYGCNPYPGYDNVNRPPFLYQGPATPGELPAVARVLTVDFGEEAVAYPYQVLQDLKVVNDTVAGNQIAVFWQAGTASALDRGQISEGRDIGTANAYSRELNGQSLTFAVNAQGEIVDEQTGSQWSVLGKATSGELAGEQLEPAIAINHFWFSWAAFKPETHIFQPGN
jgi:predicted ester cyclase